MSERDEGIAEPGAGTASEETAEPGAEGLVGETSGGGEAAPGEQVREDDSVPEPIADEAPATEPEVELALVPEPDATEQSSAQGDEPAQEEPTPSASDESLGEPAAAALDDEEEPDPEVTSIDQLQSILESMIFASDKPLSTNDLKRLVGERNGDGVAEALDSLRARYEGAGIQLAAVAGGWQFRTSAANAHWVTKLIAGKPARLSRAMLETLAIVAYRQPVTRPEIDEIRGVDCGPVLKTLLDRNLVRILGKKEEVGRPLLYGTTVDFLKTFSLKELTELPTLREFHELSSADMERVDAEAPAAEGAGQSTAADRWAAHIAAGGNAVGAGATEIPMPERGSLPELNQEEQDALLAELDEATEAAKRAMDTQEPSEQDAAQQTSGGEGGRASDEASSSSDNDDDSPARREPEPEPEL